MGVERIHKLDIVDDYVARYYRATVGNFSQDTGVPPLLYTG